MKFNIEKFNDIARNLGPEGVQKMIEEEREALKPKTKSVSHNTSSSEEKMPTKTRQSKLLGKAIERLKVDLAKAELALQKSEEIKKDDTKMEQLEKNQLESEIQRLSALLNKTQKEKEEAEMEIQDLNDAASAGVYNLLNKIRGRIPTYAEQIATDPSFDLVQAILKDEKLHPDLRGTLQNILEKHIIKEL
jgi:chromosome segregation ATPase